jgi:hypothetical protein
MITCVGSFADAAETIHRRLAFAKVQPVGVAGG